MDVSGPLWLSWLDHLCAHASGPGGQGVLIFLCRTAGVIALLSALGFWIDQGFAQAIPGFLFMAGFFVAANKLELRWRSW